MEASEIALAWEREKDTSAIHSFPQNCKIPYMI